jgi:hypothetical protein
VLTSEHFAQILRIKQFNIAWVRGTMELQEAREALKQGTGLLAFLPQFLLGPFAGVWIDRLSRKF